MGDFFRNYVKKDKEYHVICLSGGRSSMVCDFLGNQGYDVVNVMGGMSAWRGDIE
ncbi:rhodanese-like domain-containing protein [Alkalibacterium indicireducens]|uniref:rhodanese-like domain-containing protein n=1 Tax=Alkalibacterium indicireducens TaxID=398758 RepID=UPI0031F82D9C